MKRNAEIYVSKNQWYKIKNRLEKALSIQFDAYSWCDMIDDCDDLTETEKIWAKEHSTYKLDIDKPE